MSRPGEGRVAHLKSATAHFHGCRRGKDQKHVYDRFLEIMKDFKATK